jgi:hypothetical protein
MMFKHQPSRGCDYYEKRLFATRWLNPALLVFFESTAKKVITIVRTTLQILIPYGAVIMLWYCYITYGQLLSNGKNPDSYNVMTKRIGGDWNIYSATRIDVDPLPVVAMLILTVVSIFVLWFCANLFVPHIFEIIKRPTRESEEIFRRSLVDVQSTIRKTRAYKDRELTETDEELTDYLFVRALTVNDL